ncbi:MAG: hypothetical protein WCT29_00630 [Candidatus Paceibacterota bacterium]|jgi:hypothetical protein
MYITVRSNSAEIAEARLLQSAVSRRLGKALIWARLGRAIVIFGHKQEDQLTPGDVQLLNGDKRFVAHESTEEELSRSGLRIPQAS